LVRRRRPRRLQPWKLFSRNTEVIADVVTPATFGDINLRVAVGESAEEMDMTATQKYFNDIGVSLEDVSCLIAFQIVQCTSIGEISKDGFLKGWAEHKYVVPH
jgi:hypothetical protein